MHILITGGEGFVGGAYQRYFQRDQKAVCRIVDLKNGEDCRDFFKETDTKFDLIIHLAAIVGGRITIEGDPLSVATDLSIDSEFFNWLIRSNQTCPVIYFSSSAAYPIELQERGKRIPLAEDLIDYRKMATPDYTYGWAKLSGEFLADFARKEGKKIHVFRPFSGYGSDQALDYPFPSFIDRIQRRVDQFEIWGDGTQTRDFIHINDIVEATMTAVELEFLEPLNLGSGVATSFNSLYEAVVLQSGHRPSKGIKHLVEKPVGVHYRFAEISKMRLLYTPKISISDGIDMALAGEL